MTDDKIIKLFGANTGTIDPAKLAVMNEEVDQLRNTVAESIKNRNAKYIESLRALANRLEDEDDPLSFRSFVLAFYEDSGAAGWTSFGMSHQDLCVMVKYVDHAVMQAMFPADAIVLEYGTEFDGDDDDQ